MRGLFLILFALLIHSCKANASHIIGHEIIYSIDENGNAELGVVMYRDCAGIEEPTIAPIIAVSECGDSLTLEAVLTTEPANDVWSFMPYNQYEVVWNCPSNCEETFVRPGVERFIYRWSGQLPTCNEWTLTHTFCCYSNIDNIEAAGQYDATAISKVFLPNGQGNSSARFVAPSQFACSSGVEPILLSAFDTDGDSLTYELSPLHFGRNPSDTLVFITGCNSQQPIPNQSISLSSESGLITTAIQSQGDFQIGLTVSEYRNGNLVGTTTKSANIRSFNCQTTGSINTNVQQGNLVNGVLEPAVGEEVIIEYSAQVGNPENYYLHCTTCEHLENYTWNTSVDLQSGIVTATLNWTPVAHELEIPLHVRLLQSVCENNFSSTTMLFSIQEATITKIGEGELEKLMIFPNPSNGLFTVKTAYPISGFRLYDCMGKLLQSRNWNSNSNQFHVDIDVPNGVYLLSTIGETHSTHNRISINH